MSIPQRIAERLHRLQVLVGLERLPPTEDDARRLAVWRGVEEAPSAALSRLRWAIYSLNYGRTEIAIQTLREARRVSDTPAEVEYADALAHIMTGSHKRAHAHLLEATRSRALFPETFALIALELSDLGSPEAATSVVERLPINSPIRRDLSTLLVEGMLKKGTFPEALPLLRDFQREHPDDPRVLAATGLVLCNLGRYPEAVRELERSVAFHDGDPETWGLLGAASAAIGDRTGALRAFDQALAIDPGYFDHREDQRQSWESVVHGDGTRRKITLLWRIELRS